jgi:potassium channel subfamily K
VYADTLASTPKKYSYADWAYFLKLLGEDESDETVHKTPGAVVAEEGPNAVASAREQALNSSGQEAASDPKDKEDAHQKAEKQKWSWIGVRSPLMGDQEEAEWLLEKFFQRLEESLHGEGLEKEDKIKRETAKHHPSQQGQEEAGGDEGASDEGSSEDTISRGEPNEAKDKDNN